VPAGTAEGSYPIRVLADSGTDTARATGSVLVIGNTIEFDPGSDAERPWLFEDNGSQLTNVNNREGRYADGTSWFTYRFDLPADVTGGTVTLDIGNEFLVQASTDGTTWRTVLQDTNQVHDLSNLQPRDLDLNDLRAGGQTVYLRVADSKTDDGWGGWLAHVKVAMTTG
jgi:hypothetical protein